MQEIARKASPPLAVLYRSQHIASQYFILLEMEGRGHFLIQGQIKNVYFKEASNK